MSTMVVGLQEIRQWKIPRCLTINGLTVTGDLSLLCHSDASEKGYGGSVYLKVTEGDVSRVSLVISRARVAPLKKISLPRMSLATKIRLAQCYVWSTLLYGCETWSLTQTNEMKLRGFEMWMYRRIGRVSWKAKKTNKEVLNKLGLQSTMLMTVVRQRIVRFYGHVRRQQQSTTYNHRRHGKWQTQSRKEEMRMAGKRLPIYRNEHKQMRRNCYQQGRMEDHSIQRRVRRGTAVR